MSPLTPDPGFYSVTAQVLPTLLLTFYVERGRFSTITLGPTAAKQLRDEARDYHGVTRLDRPTTKVGAFYHAAWTMALMGTLAIGQAASFAGMAGVDARWIPQTIVMSIGFSSSALILPLMMATVATATLRISSADFSETSEAFDLLTVPISYLLMLACAIAPVAIATWAAVNIF